MMDESSSYITNATLRTDPVGGMSIIGASPLSSTGMSSGDPSVIVLELTSMNATLSITDPSTSSTLIERHTGRQRCRGSEDNATTILHTRVAQLSYH